VNGTDSAVPYQVGEWLPSDQLKLEDWRHSLIRETTDATGETSFFPVILEFKEIIEDDPELFMLFTQMFEQVSKDTEHSLDPSGYPQIQSYLHMLRIMNHVLTKAPGFDRSGFVGFPINAILNWPLQTGPGLSIFRNEKVNRQLKKILNQWSVFLASPDSRYVLDDDTEKGWFGKEAQEAMPDFIEDFVCEPGAPYYGFTSWDDFFTRRFRDGRRPIEDPNDDSVIANACESAPFKLVFNAHLRDNFWIKSQPYSLFHLLAGDALAPLFEGGTVYQAFLSALSYHRWHSPVSGIIVKTRVIDGTYYSQSPSIENDPYSPNASQAYISHMASRALIFIEADNPDIGLMCIVFVGMGEVSSNEITVYEGQHVQKGEQLGMFHFGGSTHVLIFRAGLNLQFDLRGQTPGLNSQNIAVGAKIATVVK
jgi:phosphatidylserine decarboxylase